MPALCSSKNDHAGCATVAHSRRESLALNRKMSVVELAAANSYFVSLSVIVSAQRLRSDTNRAFTLRRLSDPQLALSCRLPALRHEGVQKSVYGYQRRHGPVFVFEVAWLQGLFWGSWWPPRAGVKLNPNKAIVQAVDGEQLFLVRTSGRTCATVAQ